MNSKKCPQCGAAKIKKNGTRNGVQLYKCLVCQHQFRGGILEHPADLWNAYQNHKQTIQQLAKQRNISPSSVKRQLQRIERKWEQPTLVGQSRFVHLDVTYWGHNWGVLLALDDATGKPLYLAFIKSETTQDYRTAIDHISTALQPVILYEESSLMARNRCLRSFRNTLYKCANSISHR